MRALAIALICLSTAAFAQDEQAYAMEAIASMAAGPRFCPGFLPNAPVVKALVMGSKLKLDEESVKAQVLKYGQILENRHATMDQKSFCDMMWMAWGTKGQIVPDVLAR